MGSKSIHVEPPVQEEVELMFFPIWYMSASDRSSKI